MNERLAGTGLAIGLVAGAGAGLILELSGNAGANVLEGIAESGPDGLAAMSLLARSRSVTSSPK